MFAFHLVQEINHVQQVYDFYLAASNESLQNLALQHAIGWFNLGLEEPFIVLGRYSTSGQLPWAWKGGKLNRTYLHFKLTLYYIEAKLDLFGQDAAESRCSLERLLLPMEIIHFQGPTAAPQQSATFELLKWDSSFLAVCMVETSMWRWPLKQPTAFREGLSNSEGWKKLDTKDGTKHKKNKTYCCFQIL